MEALGVVAADPGEDLAAGLVACREAALVHELSFEGGEERFGDAVVPAVPHPACGLAHLVARQRGRELGAEILAGFNAVRVAYHFDDGGIWWGLDAAAVSKASMTRRAGMSAAIE